MNTVKVRRNELLEKIEHNRAKHYDLLAKAKEGYRKLVIRELAKALRAARAGGALQTAFALTPPQDHTADYDRAIDMLKMSVDDTIELSADDFQRYVRDEWMWSAGTLLVNSQYASGV